MNAIAVGINKPAVVVGPNLGAGLQGIFDVGLQAIFPLVIDHHSAIAGGRNGNHGLDIARHRRADGLERSLQIGLGHGHIVNLRDGVRRRRLDVDGLTSNHQAIAVITAGCLAASVTVDKHGGKGVTLVTRRVGTRVEAGVHGMAEFLYQYQFDGFLTGPRCQPIGIDEDHPLTVDATFGKGTQGLMHLLRADQFDAQRSLS